MAKKKKQGAVTGATKHSVSARDQKAVPSPRLDQDDPDTKSVRTIQPIVATINPRETGPKVANLQDALLALLARDKIWRVDASNRPTPEELQKLTEGIRQERTQSLFEEITARLVRDFQVQQVLNDNLRGVVEDTTAAKLNELLESVGALDEEALLTVRGTVTTADGQPIRGAIVRAFDRDLRKEPPLGDPAETNDQGEYVIPYTVADFSSGDVPSAPTPKLIVRAFKGDQQIGDDVSRPQPTRDEVVDFKSSAPVLSEWEKLSTGIMPLLKGQGEKDQRLPPWEVNDGDLDFITEETGLEREKIRLWARAFTVSRDTEAATPPVAVTSAIFYGWFLQGLPLDGYTLLERPTLELITAIRKSIEANFVPWTLSDRLEELEATLNRLRAARALEPAPEGTPSSLGDLLGTLPSEQMLSRDQQLTVARLSHEHGHTEEFWTRAEAAGLSNAIPALKRTLALGELSVGHARVVQALQTKSDAERPESIEFLTTLEPIDWIELVFEHGAPSGSGLDRDAYIERLQSEVEAKFPTQMLGKQLQKKLGESESFPTGKVVDFLKANPDFDLRKRHVEPYLNELDNRDDSLREGLLRLGRIHALTANARETMALHDAGFGSSTQIVSEGKPAFMLKVGHQLSAERAEQVFAAAEHVMTTVVAIGTAYVAPSASGNAVYVIPAQTVSETTLKEYPSLRSLFGDLDYCECRHCQSVLGPAAYLTDLLHFLQRSKLTAAGSLSLANNINQLNPYLEYAAGGTVLGALLQRRPDLADLELSCENTDTKIPYIDLVLEILENAVALPMVVPPSEYKGVNIKAEFAGGTIPEAVVDALRKTSIKIGKNLTLTPDPHLNSNSAFLNWIITDGSRRWLIQYCEGQLVMIQGAGDFQILDVAAAVDSLTHGTLNAELKNRFSEGLPLDGVPEINEVPMRSGGRGWTVSYTQAIAIEIRLGAVELLHRDGTQFHPRRLWLWPPATIKVILHAFTSDATSKINAYVARVLGLPANETYVQTWNADKNWWELSITNTATLEHRSEELTVAGLTYQNSSIHEHLESAPENRNPAAYEKLSTEKTVFPWALPFDLWLEEMRAFLEALGIPRAHLIELARPQSRLSEEAAALELLGVSKSEADLITSAMTSTTPWTYWGLEQLNNIVMDQTAGGNRKGGWLEVLGNVSMLLQQSGLSYREYLDFRETSFAGQLKGTLLPPNECKTSMIIVVGLNAAQLQNHLDHVHVFTRLWRKSGWSMRELDLALAAFGGQIKPTVLQDLALLKRLQTMLQLPVTVLIGCIHILETQAWTDHTKDGTPLKPALYDRVFQRQSLRSLTGFKEFSLEKLDRRALSISDRDFVAASLGIKPDQVGAWIIGTPSLGIADSANLDSLSRLYAAATLCRALSIAPDVLPDIVTLLLGPATDLFSTLPAPITPDDIAQQARVRARAMLEFAERVEFVRKSGFDFETLSYLFRHRVLPGKGNDASTRIEQQLTQTLTDLRSALQSGVVLGNVSADNVKRQLARLGWYPALIDDAMGSAGLNYQPNASVDIIPPLSRKPTIPLNLRSKFTYRKIDATKAVLECIGSLDESDFRSLKSPALFPEGTVPLLKSRYHDNLDDHVRTLAGLMRVFKLPKFEQVVNTLTTLPVIPADFKDRLNFEMAKGGTLTLTGWLSDSEKKTVLGANRSNAVLSTALDSLQTQSMTYIAGPTVSQFITSTDAEKLLREPDVEVRYRTILLRLVSRLDLDLLLTQLSQSLGLDQKVVAKLLDTAKVNKRNAKDLLTDSDFLRSEAKLRVEGTTGLDQFAVLELLSKIATIGNPFAIAPEQWDWVLSSPFTIVDVLALPTSTDSPVASFDGWRQFVDLFHLRDVLPDGSSRLFKIATALKASDFDSVRKQFSLAFELSETEVMGACSATLLDFEEAGSAKDYNNPSRLLQLAQLLHVIKSLGATSNSIRLLIQAAPTESEAQLARTLFAASITADAYPERLRPISNRLRNLQRDALVAYLIHRDHLADSNELFDRYLIDVEMGACMLTSRMKQAISSVQLFVQRCLLNLERPAHPHEPGVSPISIDSQRWQWMKYYRVWEANRKIFLYPENWIEPELRDDKSEIFQALESDLLQSELTHDTALVSFRKYLDGLSDVARLTVVSMYDELVDNDTLVHLVGRDNGQPHKHYYRQWRLRPDDDYGTWTPWEEISTQIESGHVVVFVHAGDVHLAWPSFSKNTSELHWMVSMNLARRNSSGWTKLKKGQGEFSCAMLPNKNESRSFAFRFVPKTVMSPASIECYAMTAKWITPRSPESQFQAIDTNALAQERSLALNVRVLTKLKDSSGAVFFKDSDPNFTWVKAILYFWNPSSNLSQVTVVNLIGNSGGVFSYNHQLKTWPGVSPGSTFLGIYLEAGIRGTQYKKIRDLDLTLFSQTTPIGTSTSSSSAMKRMLLLVLTLI